MVRDPVSIIARSYIDLDSIIAIRKIRVPKKKQPGTVPHCENQRLQLPQ